MMTLDDEAPRSWTSEHFSLANPRGVDQDDLPLLLRRLADELVTFGEIRVVDLILHRELTDDGLLWPSITVYFKRIDDEDGRLPV